VGYTNLKDAIQTKNKETRRATETCQWPEVMLQSAVVKLEFDDEPVMNMIHGRFIMYEDEPAISQGAWIGPETLEASCVRR
jgi:hypothetical protein